MSTTSAISPPEIPLNTSTDDFDFDSITQRQERFDQVIASLKGELPRLYNRLGALEVRAKYPKERFAYYNKKTKKDVFAQVFTGIFPDEPPYTRMIHAIATANVIEGAHIWYCPNSMNSGVYAFGTRLWDTNVFRYTKHSKDPDCVRRVKFPIDIDPQTTKRVDPITGEKLEGSTSEEQARALMVGQEVIDFLLSYGFPAPHWVSSGNGSQLMYDVQFDRQDDLKDKKPEDAENVLKRVYDILRHVFTDRGVTFDMGPLRPSSGLRLPGTFNIKAPGTAELPKRLAETLYYPEELVYVPLETFRALVHAFPHAPRLGNAKAPTQPRNGSSASRSWYGSTDGERGVKRSIAIIEAFCLDNELNYTIDNTSQGTFYRLDHCLYQEEREGVNHEPTSNHAFIQLFPEGKLGAGCQRPDCDEYVKSQPLSGWEWLKRIADPEYAQRKEQEEAQEDHQAEVLMRLENARKQMTNGVVHQAQPSPEHDQADQDDPEDVGSIESPQKKSVLEQAQAIVDEVIASQDTTRLYMMDALVIFSDLFSFELTGLLAKLKEKCPCFKETQFRTDLKEVKKVSKIKDGKKNTTEETSTITANSGKVKPVINLYNREPDDIADDIACVLKERMFYKREDAICRILPYWEEGKRPLKTYDTKKITTYVLESMAFRSLNNRGEIVMKDPSERLLNLIIHDEGERFERLKGLTHTPIITKDGRIILEPGFDKASGIYYQPTNNLYLAPEFREALEQPVSQAQAQEALQTISGYLNEFPWVDSPSLTNYLGLLLAGVARSVIDAPIPLHLIDANHSGAGKTLLATLVFCLVLGEREVATVFPSNNEEFRKLITSTLAGGQPIVLFDNIVGKVYFPALRMLLTTNMWNDRILGKSETVSLPQRTLWIMTGNNIQLGSDEDTRRCVLIQLETPEDKPQKIPHTIENLIKFFLENRPHLLQQLLLVVKAWFDVPEGERRKGETIGSFGEWGKTIGGMLAYAGREDFLANENLLEEKDRDSDEWAQFFATWYDVFTMRHITMRELVETIFGRDMSQFAYPETTVAMTKGRQDLQDAMPEYVYTELVKMRDITGKAKRLGAILRLKLKANCGGCILQKVEPLNHRDPAKWYVVPERCVK